MTALTRTRREAGFTLIEVVAAFAIFALCVGALYESFSGSVRRSARSRETTVAALAAQSLLAEQRGHPGPWDSRQSGAAQDGTSWQIDVKPYDADTDPGSEWHLYEVTVRVGPETHADAVLQSVELVRIPR